ncbi:MAG: undecaprenyl-diphosphate phosphatase [Sandaracinus sp.]|nr:undecaprenyl-diphosphate phosphatase [Myxococcales bacterium]MCB9612203.1 undecaprenyl-diphosphate phosphatase [Sandaracinus sp.]MCB9618374.1 undecaprenyl-diphosphate phosphatase [Sandaracinus sp.]MCB9623060.1 undecaprenyl-diphosphate phosphatase [Sandaracinus sp.]MCB9634838.1 undecaprenyl-diphosphate phosphatase [Sandaracinus sp.]
MELWEALLLGLVEGLTEYLPVSSTGHLLVTQRLMGIEASEAANAFAIVIQAGAIVAVLGLYRARVLSMLKGLVGKDPEGLKLALALVAAFVPAAAAGLLLGDTIKSVLFGTWPVVAAWVVGGVLLVAFGKKLRTAEGAGLESLDVRRAVIVGVFQCLALWPGTSRSLAAIVGGIVVGLSLPAAVELSFLLGLLTLGAATAYETLQSGSVMLEAYGAAPLAVGFAAAWASAVVAVRFMVRSLQRYGLSLYGWWRIAIGIAVGAWMLSGGG